MEPEPFDSTRPYECRSCHGLMRTRGTDGVCYSCLHPTPLRCASCARVKWLPPEYLADWQDHPGKLPSEIEAECPTCAETRRKRLEAAYWRHVRETARRMERGFGPPADGEDPFKGFREAADTGPESPQAQPAVLTKGE